MSVLQTKDDRLSGLLLSAIPSSAFAGISYALRKILGEGAMAVAFLADRHGQGGTSPAVVKVMRPSIAEAGGGAALAAHKEATALLQLGSAGVPTPYVVRMLDLGHVMASTPEGRPLSLPWIAMEYVEGGEEGTTLLERVRKSTKSTALAFAPRRGQRAIECLTQGLSAVHQAGIVHRDIKPANVLCSGSGATEILKIADFGIARAEGVAATFGPAIVGSLGYAPPEQLEMRTKEIGPWSDVFALAGVIYFLLTGERYFPPESLAQTLRLIRSPQRRKLRDAAGLHPDLRAREYDCAAIDAVLADATAAKVGDRIQSIAALAEPILRALQPRETVRPPALDDLEEVDAESFVETEVERDATTVVRPWQWTMRQIPGSQKGIRSVAWNSDGGCLAATGDGLRFWDGANWHPVSVDGLPDTRAVRFVTKLPPSSWLIGGDGGMLSILSHEGVRHLPKGPDAETSFDLASGDLGDLAVLVGVKKEGPPCLYPVVGKYWLKPYPLNDIAVVNSIARLSRDTWLLAGRRHNGTGFAAFFLPTRWEMSPIQGCPASVYFQCAANIALGMGLIVGNDGCFARVSASVVEHEHLQQSTDLTAGALDEQGRFWLGGLGGLWVQETQNEGRCLRAWGDERWTAPVKSIHAENGRVLLITSNGGVLVGKSQA